MKSLHRKCNKPNSDTSVCSQSSGSRQSSNTLYLAVLERRETADHAKLIADQVEEWSKWKLKVIEKTLELEKEKLKNEKFEARNNTVLAEFESRYDETSQISDNKISVEIKTSLQEFSIEEKTISKEINDNNQLVSLELYLKP